MKYRKDSRTEEEFAADIANSTATESKLMQVYVDSLSARKNLKYTFINNGTDNSGTVHADDKLVSTRADFLLVSPDGKRRLIEIKFSRPERSRFHLKTSQIKRYQKDDAAIVMFMGVDTDNCRYTIILPKDYNKIQTAADIIKMWGKEVYRLYCKDFTWIDVGKINV